MRSRVVIVGDLPHSADRDAEADRKRLLEQLTPVSEEIEWDWILPCDSAYNLPKNELNRLLAVLRDKNKQEGPIVVVKLYCLNGRARNALYTAGAEPLLPPKTTATVEDLVDWLMSDAGLGLGGWSASVGQAALVALFAKLIRNKSWNKDGHGHHWTQERDLLGQAPVMTPDQKLYGPARELLRPPLFLSKGSEGGKTPLSWSINTAYLPVVKRVIIERSFDALRDVAELHVIVGLIDVEGHESIVIDTTIVSDTVRSICEKDR